MNVVCNSLQATGGVDVHVLLLLITKSDCVAGSPQLVLIILYQSGVHLSEYGSSILELGD